MKNDWDIGPQAARLHSEALVWDNHGCMPIETNDKFLPELQRWAAAGVNVACVNVGYGEIPWQQHVLTLAFMRRWLIKHTDDYALVTSVDDIHQAKADGKLAVAFDIEGGAAIEHEISLIQMFYDLGVRWMLMAYNLNNKLGGGCHDIDTGLTDFGREVLDEMAKVGMVACCSHTGYRTTRDVFNYSTNPVLLSHSNPKVLKDHPRNVPDELILACARTGGVVGITGIGLFLADDDPSVSNLVRHIDYVVQLVGSDHVGIGLDFVFDPSELDTDVATQSETFPPGFGYGGSIKIASPECLPRITEGLLGLGYAEYDVLKILGKNLLRVAENVWK